MGDLAVLEALAADVLDSGAPLTSAALHGAVCGFAVFDPLVFPYYELADLLDPDLAGDDPALARFVAAVREELDADELSFAPLLPDDGVPLEDRLETLGIWCASFLQAFGSGLALAPEGSGPGASGYELPEEIQEIIDDLAAVAGVEPESAMDLETEGGDAEAQLMELEEFVKVAVLLIMSVLSRDPADQDD